MGAESCSIERNIMKYRFTSEVTVSAITIVEAETLDEALELAEDREPVIGGLGTGTSEYESWVIDDADGSATNITHAE